MRISFRKLTDNINSILNFRGFIDASTNPNYPAGVPGDTYFISVAGRLGGAAGAIVSVGDLPIVLIANAGGTQAAVGSDWGIVEGNIGYTPENVANKSTDGTLASNSDILYPSQKATKTYADTKVSANAPITPATNTKITYDANGLITASSSANTADINDSTNRRYVTDSELTNIAALPNISGNAATVTTNANLTGAITSTGNTTSLGSFTSANLAGALTDETGTGSAVFANSPVLVTPNLGTPSTLVGTNITGTASGLTAGTVTTNANLTGDVTSNGSNATTIGAGKVTEAMQVLANNTTNNVSTSKHGYVPILPNDATKYFDGTGNYSAPPAIIRGLLTPFFNVINNSDIATVIPGIIEVNGTNINVSSANISRASSVFLDSQVTPTDPSGWYCLAVNSSGNFVSLFTGGRVAQASQSVTNSSGTTTKTLTVASVPGSGSEIYIAYITKGSGSFGGVYTATRLSSTTFSIPIDSGFGNTTTGMTVTLRFLNSNDSVAFSGTNNVFMHTPTMVLNETLNGYYLDADGQNNSTSNVYRVVCEYNVSGASLSFSYSYGFGSIKNNNYFEVYNLANRGSTNTNVRRNGTIVRLHGMFSSGYADSSTLGATYTMPRNSMVTCNISAQLQVSLMTTACLMRNSTTTAIIQDGSSHLLCSLFNNNTNPIVVQASSTTLLLNNDVISYTSNTSDSAADITSWKMQCGND